MTTTRRAGTSSRPPRDRRTRISCIVEIRGSRQSFFGEVRDLSVEGLCFSSPILMPLGERAGCTLCLNGAVESSLSFEVRWAVPESRGRSLIGGEFVHTPDSRKGMKLLLWQIECGSVTGAVPPKPPPGN